MKYYSQDGQDKFLVEEIFKNKSSGFYIEIGANDGITLSNTKTLEDIGWDGACIEPLPESYEKLKYNRSCIKHNVAISNKTGKLSFLQIDGYSEMLSGILDSYDPRHLERVNREITHYGGSKKVIEVDCFKFSDLIDVVDIDYISIDVEGSELDILKSINFDYHNIYCISVENNYGSIELNEFLISKNYKQIKSIGADNFFIKNG